MFYRIECEYFNIKQFIKANGGLKKQEEYGNYRPY